MRQTWKRAVAPVVIACLLAITSPAVAGHRHGGSCGSSGGYGGGYAYSDGYGGGYAYADGSPSGSQDGYAGGWTTVTQPTYRRGLFGRRIFAGNQVVTVPANAEVAPQTTAHSETEIDRSARAPGGRTQTEIDGSRQPSEPGIDGIAPRSNQPMRPLNREDNVVPPPPPGNAEAPPSNGNDNGVAPRQNTTPLIP
jgi:hypothetical protein